MSFQLYQWNFNCVTDQCIVLMGLNGLDVLDKTGNLWLCCKERLIEITHGDDIKVNWIRKHRSGFLVCELLDFLLSLRASTV